MPVPSPVGVTVEEALSMPCLAGARVLAGRSGLRRKIRVVNIMEVPDIVRWMRGGELLLTTAYPVRDDVAALIRLVPELAARGVTALGIRIGPYVDQAPKEMLARADQLHFPVIEIPSTVVFNDILSQVIAQIVNRQASELERSQAIHQRLTAVVLAGGSFPQLIQAVSELIGRPVAILDTHGRVLTASASFESGMVEGMALPGVPIRVGSVSHGEVVVRSERQGLAPHEVTTVEHAATIAALLFAQERAVASRQQRHRTLLLMELVSGRPFDRADMTERAAAMGWDLHVPRAALVVQLTDRMGVAPIAGTPLEEALQRAVRRAAGPSAIVWALKSSVAMLVEPRPSARHVARAVHDAAAHVRGGREVTIGAGRPYEDAGDLHRSYHEAQEALLLARELGATGGVIEHDELGIYRLLSRLPTDELRAFCESTLGPLLEYDRRHRGSLIQTLEAYLGAGRNRVVAAQELYVHYNTLRYRLGQIARLTGGIDRHPTSRLGLETALHAHRLLEARSAATGTLGSPAERGPAAVEVRHRADRGP
jgi:purine catabolism regulator